jgi:hypothetical protein
MTRSRLAVAQELGDKTSSRRLVRDGHMGNLGSEGEASMAWGRRAGTALLAVAMLAPPVWADTPGEKGGGKAQGYGPGRGGRGHGNPNTDGPTGFAGKDWPVIQSYYASPITGPNCPPGLAKKNNGCMPPGQAKQYVVGKPLPPGVVMYPLPSDLLASLAPPPGYQYMRVGSDILMLAIGTNMVVSALTNMVR